MADELKGRVTGIGGIFIKSDEPENLKKWYVENLGLKENPYGSLFEFRSPGDPIHRKYLQWSTMPTSSNYFAPSEASFMVNYRVENIEALLDSLVKAGAEIISKVESYEYGKFAHVMDPDGNKIELWEPIDEVFDEANPTDTTTF